VINRPLNLQSAQIEKPERVSFHTLTLRPHWFVNVDSRKFVFHGCGMELERNEYRRRDTEPNGKGWPNENLGSPRRLLAIACRQLAENAEANNRYEEASRFRYWRWIWRGNHKWAGLAFWKDRLAARFLLGGERLRRADPARYGMVCRVWIISVLLYTQVGFTKPEDKSATLMANPAIATEPDTIGQPLRSNALSLTASP